MYVDIAWRCWAFCIHLIDPKSSWNTAPPPLSFKIFSLSLDFQQFDQDIARLCSLWIYSYQFLLLIYISLQFWKIFSYFSSQIVVFHFPHWPVGAPITHLLELLSWSFWKSFPSLHFFSFPMSLSKFIIYQSWSPWCFYFHSAIKPMYHIFKSKIVVFIPKLFLFSLLRFPVFFMYFMCILFCFQDHGCRSCSKVFFLIVPCKFFFISWEKVNISFVFLIYCLPKTFRSSPGHCDCMLFKLWFHVQMQSPEDVGVPVLAARQSCYNQT